MDKAQYALMYHIEDSHWWYLGMRGITRTLLSRTQKPGSGATMLDAGCGTGGYLASYEGPGFGVDYSPDALEYCQKRGLATVSRASVQALPFLDESFDLVVSSDVLYHLGVSDDIEALREFWRVLRPGGTAIIRLPAYDWLRGAHDTAVHTRYRYTGGELQARMKDAGFEVLRITHANCLLFPLALAKRLLEGRLIASSSELEEASILANWVGRCALSVEAQILRFIDLPWGLSVIGVGRK
jgi:SAM-dependent methyltransferase